MNESLVTVATFDDATRANLARNRLEAEGIAAVLMDESTVATDWLLSNAVGGIKLQVTAVDVERAEFLLEQRADPEPEVPATAITTPATAEELAEEREAERVAADPVNQMADRAIRSAVVGWLFPPLQLYTLWLLVGIGSSATAVSPDRRWKVWAAVLLNLPGLYVLFVFARMLLGR